MPPEGVGRVSGAAGQVVIESGLLAQCLAFPDPAGLIPLGLPDLVRGDQHLPGVLCRQPGGCRRNRRRNRKIVMDVSWSLTRAERPVPSWLSMRVRWPGWDCERRDDPPPLPAHVGKLFFL